MLSDRSCWRHGAAVAVLVSTLLSRSVVNSSETVQPNEDAKRLLGEHFDGAKIIAIRKNAILTVDLGSGRVKTLASFKQAKRFQGLNRPWWSRDGKEVIVSYAGQAHRMDADGANFRKILEGERAYAAKFWDDPETGERCILYMTAYGKHWYPRHKKVGQTWLYRPDRKKTKLADFPFGGNLSPDGTHLGEAYGGCLMKELATGKVHILYGGKQACNATMSPDDTYRLMHLYLPHKYFGIRNKYDKELWRIDSPKGSQEWQTPRWSNHPDFCTATAKFGKEYKIVLVEISTKKLAIVRELKGSWSVPSLWLRPARLAGPTVAAGPIDHLKLARLGEYKSRLARASDYSPIIQELRQRADPEAKSIIAELETLGTIQLAKANASDDAREAAAIYKELTARFRDHPLGKQAADVLRSSAFRRESEAADALEQLTELAKRLYPVSGAKKTYADQRFLARNRAVLAQMIHLISEIEQDYAGTHACRKARAIGKEYGLPKRAIAPANERLVVTASIEAVSKVPTAQQIAPYRDAVTYIVYKADKVIDGKYDDERIVVVHWGMKNAKHTPAASWKRGRKQKLTLDLFDAHKELQGVTAAQDADEPELIPYWALKVERHR